MRVRIVAVLLGCLLSAALLATPPSIAAAPAQGGAPPGFVSVEGDHFTLDGKRFVMKGFNYYPRDYGWTSLADWDWAAVDRELDLAQSVGANTLRTGLNFLHATGNTHGALPVEEHLTATPAYLAAIDHLLELIDRHGMKAIIWVNDALPWELQRPGSFDRVRRHLESIVPRYAHDTRIAAWDLFTDIDAATLLPESAGGAAGLIPWATKPNMLGFLREEAGLFRSLDPNHPLAVGFSWPTSSLLVQEFTDFLLPQFLGGDHPEILAGDSIGPRTEDYGQWDRSRSEVMASLEAKVRFLQRNLTRSMPIVLSEFGLPSGGSGSSPQLQAGVYDAVCDLAFTRLRLAGALAWTLTDFAWPPKADTHVPPDSVLGSAEERSFGAWDLEYRPKPAVDVVRRYFAPAPTLTVLPRPDELRLAFSRTFVPGSGDSRVLSVALDWVDFLSARGARLARIDVGTAAGRRYLADGFSTDEGPWETEAKTFAWVEGRAATATVRFPFPAGTARVAVRLMNDLSGQAMTPAFGGVKGSRAAVGVGWRTYRVGVPPSAATVEKPFAVRVRFSIPVSGGTLTIETRTGSGAWRAAARVTPKAGFAAASVVFRAAGPAQVRATWSGSGLYGAASSAAVTFRVGR